MEHSHVVSKVKLWLNSLPGLWRVSTCAVCGCVGRAGALTCSGVRVFVSLGAWSAAEVCSVSHQCNATAGTDWRASISIYFHLIKCHHSCCHAELRRSDLEVTARHLNEVEALQHMHLTNIFLYGSDCWAISKTDARKIDALDQWWLRMLLGIKWYQFVWNDDVRRLTKQPKLCYNPVAPAYPIWAYYAHGRQCRCREDPVSLPSGRLEKTPRSSPHHVAQHHATGSETTSPYAPRSSRFGSEPPSVVDDVDVWRYAIVSCMPETTTTTRFALSEHNLVTR